MGKGRHVNTISVRQKVDSLASHPTCLLLNRQSESHFQASPLWLVVKNLDDSLGRLLSVALILCCYALPSPPPLSPPPQFQIRPRV